jgi:hypothetical protein
MKKKNDITIKILLFIFKKTIKVLATIARASIKEIKYFVKKRTKQSILTYLFFTSICVVSICVVFDYQLNYITVLLCTTLYFIIFGTIREVISRIKKAKNKAKIKLLNRRYKAIRALFNNKINIVSATNSEIIIFSDSITTKDLLQQKDRLEVFFNRKISYIQKRSNFKYNRIIFHTETKFKKFYRFDHYMNFVDKNKIKKMELPFIYGIDQQENILIGDMAKIKYLFVAGEAGGGKSVMLNCIIQSLMIFKNDVIYLLVDLKEGVEMSDYNKFPNCIICSTPEEFSQVLKVLDNMMIERLRKIKETDNCKNIQSYNAKKHTANMSYIVFVIDEMAELKLSSDKAGKSDEEKTLLRILQKGRAAGIFGIGATQRPGTGQIDSDVRAGFHKSISFGISRIETQRMVKVYGTENLKEGEFKTDLLDTNTVYKGFLIMEEENKMKKLPECNGVFSSLYLKLVLGIEPIQIKHKKKTNTNNLIQKFLSNRNKGYDLSYDLRQSYDLRIKYPTAHVVKEIEVILKASNFKKNAKDIHTDLEGHNDFSYENFIQFLESYSEPKTGIIPTAKKTFEKLGITEKKRTLLLKQAEKDGYIVKNGQTRFKLKVNKHI